MICDFLIYMYKKGYCSNTLNAIRSALSFFSSKKFNLGQDPYVSQLFKAFYKLRLVKCKYVAFWHVDKLLHLLVSWYPIST